MATIIFVADAAKYGIPCNLKDGITLDGKKYENGEYIVKAGPYKCHDLKRDLTVEKGQFLLEDTTDKERIEYIKAYPDYRKAYIERKILPRETFLNGSVVVGVEKVKDSPVDVQSLQKTTVDKMQVWAALQRKIYKEDGTKKQKIEEADLTEFTKLCEELGIPVPANKEE